MMDEKVESKAISPHKYVRHTRFSKKALLLCAITFTCAELNEAAKSTPNRTVTPNCHVCPPLLPLENTRRTTEDSSIITTTNKPSDRVSLQHAIHSKLQRRTIERNEV